MAPIGVALIGGGIFVKEEHLPGVLACQNLALRAIYSRSLKSAQDTASLVPGSHTPVDLYSEDSGDGKSYDDVLKRSDIAAVIIALPIRNQPEYIKKALAAGKHVLSEKPAAPDAAAAVDLINWYHGVSAEKGVTWAVAEQFRYLDKYVFAGEEARKLGKVTGFVVKVFYMMKPDNKYVGTDWRRNPTHDYGFVLDAGVHWVAALRLMLGDETVESVMGFSHTGTKHLPPPDSLHGVLRLKSGAAGSFLCSVGSTFSAQDYTVICENGSVTVARDRVTIVRGTAKEDKDFEFRSAVPTEIRAWADAMVAGKPDPRQTPEQALADLELLEGLLKSADKEGERRYLQHQ